MIIDNKSPLAKYTHIIDDNGHRRAFKWIDPIKRIGEEMIFSEYDLIGYPQGNELYTLEWKEDQTFPYNIMIREPITQKEFMNPCIHDLEMLLEKAKEANQSTINTLNNLLR